METIQVSEVEVTAKFGHTKIKNWPNLSEALLKLQRVSVVECGGCDIHIVWVYPTVREAMSLNIGDRIRATWFIEEDQK